MTRLKNVAGMYTVSRAGMTINLEDRISFGAIMGPGKQVVAGLFTFRGFQFLLYLDPEGPTDLRGLFFNGEHLAATELLFQTLTLRIQIGKHISHIVKIVR